MLPPPLYFFPRPATRATGDQRLPTEAPREVIIKVQFQRIRSRNLVGKRCSRPVSLKLLQANRHIQVVPF